MSVAEARLVAINVFLAVEVTYLFSCRSLTGCARDLGLLTNHWLVGGVALMVVLQIALTYWAPTNALFDTAPIDAITWLEIAAAGGVGDRDGLRVSAQPPAGSVRMCGGGSARSVARWPPCPHTHPGLRRASRATCSTWGGSCSA